MVGGGEPIVRRLPVAGRVRNLSLGEVRARLRHVEARLLACGQQVVDDVVDALQVAAEGFRQDEAGDTLAVGERAFDLELHTTRAETRGERIDARLTGTSRDRA